jgi:hypothetical protein
MAPRRRGYYTVLLSPDPARRKPMAWRQARLSLGDWTGRPHTTARLDLQAIALGDRRLPHFSAHQASLASNHRRRIVRFSAETLETTLPSSGA